ncbi:KH domain-containing protein [Cronbergia sp. UHCC 0137]|uniref:KH domain-containing protein n=1 Tax=Cronbergia sp. UHCC 0137 TaxID=3110239 RepID=UPI002B1FC32F|nr:KH domain-containing protein [Cronbergia sp. UHCC 0137]MEA5617869.1 KH domain-containing protein [Cronbergia sp. UHCC 0137]
MKSPAASPNYIGLVKFLVQPFLDFPDSLSVDCEISHTLKRTWIRIAFEAADKEKVFGRGGRNIQAIRTIIATAAELAGQSVYLDIYGSAAQNRDGISFDEDPEERIPPPKSRDRVSSIPRPVAKPRTR